MQYLRYNTDSQEVVFGIFVDSTDGNTEETGLTIANTDIKIWKSGATTLVNKNSGGATHISNGIYYAVFDSTDTNTLGSGKAFVHVSGALYCILEFCVLPQKVYDSMIAGSDNLEVDTIQIEGTDATNQLSAATPSVTVSDKTGFSLSSAGVTAVQSGLSTLTASDVWTYATRSLTTFGTLIADIWSYATRALTAFSFTVAATIADKTGYSLSGTKQTLDDLNDFNPSSDTVARVTLVDTCTSNTDMRGTDGANTTAPDNASIIAIKAKTDSLTFTTPLKVDATATVSTSGLATEAKQDTMITHLTDIKGSTFNGSTDSLEAIRDRGDSAWTTGGGALGSNAVTLTITDTDEVNIVEAAVEVWDSAGTSFIERKASNSSGQAVFNLDDGTYIIKCHKAGYSFENTTLTVSGNTSRTITGTAFVITPASDPDICRVYTILRDGLEFPATASGTWTAYGIIEIDNTHYSDSNTAGTYTAGTGVIYFDIPKNSVVTISIPDYITGVYEIPATDTAELSELNQKP